MDGCYRYRTHIPNVVDGILYKRHQLFFPLKDFQMKIKKDLWINEEGPLDKFTFEPCLEEKIQTTECIQIFVTDIRICLYLPSLKKKGGG